MKNKTKKRILFSVSTEYQLLVALIIIDSKFKDRELYDVFMMQLSPLGNERMGDLQLNTQFLGFKYQEFEYDYFGSYKDNAIQKIKSFLGNMVFEEFIFFNEQEFINIYFADILKKKGTKITLGPDGAKAYVKYIKSAWKYRIKLFFLFHKYFLKNKIPYINLSTFSLEYGALSTIDSLLLQYPQSFQNNYNRKLETFDFNFSKETKEWVSNIFGTNQILKGLPLDNIVFFINQGFIESSDSLNNLELSILETISNKKNTTTIIYKPHPFTKPEHIKKVKSIANVTVLDFKIPAELIILNLSNSKVISFWSTSCLVTNSSCSFFWLKKIAVKKGIFPSQIILDNPTSHIKELKDLEELSY